MENDLDKAVSERLKAGYSRAAIESELIESGYTIEGARDAIDRASINVVTLPTLGEQLKASFDYVKNRLDLLALLAPTSLPLSLYMLVVGDDVNTYSSSELMLFGVFMLFTIIAGPVANAMAVYITLYQEKRLEIADAWNFVWSHIGSFLWIWTIVPLALLGGFALFIIPGVTVSGYLMMTPLVFIKEGKRGFAALMRSHILVRGRWWTTVIRTTVVLLLAAIAAGLLSIFGPIGEVAGLLVQSAGVVMMIYIVTDCYRVYAAEKAGVTDEDTKVATLYKLLIGLGLFIIIGLSVILGLGVAVMFTGFGA